MEFRPYYLATQWQKQGNNVMIIGGSFSHLRHHNPQHKNKVFYEKIDGVQYVWLKTNSYSGNGAKRVLSMFAFVLRLFVNGPDILRKFNPDLIIASSTYPLENFPIYWLARKFKSKYCYEVHDLWPLSPMELGGMSRYHPFILLMQWAENYGYKNSDFVVSMLPLALPHMILHGLDPRKFNYIPNGIMVDDWKRYEVPQDHVNAIEKIRNKGKTIIGYAGGHAISNALEFLIEAASLTQQTAADLHFVLVGKGAEKENLIKLSNNLNLKNVLFLDPVRKNEIPGLLAAMDILYLGWRQNPLYRFGISPNKLLDYMMSGKPIVHSVNAGNDIVKEAGCGISVPAEQPVEIVRAFLEISQMGKSEQLRLGENGRNFALKNYDYEKLARAFLLNTKL